MVDTATSTRIQRRTRCHFTARAPAWRPQAGPASARLGGRPDVGHGQLEIGLAVEFVLLERVRHVDWRAMGLEERVALDAAPCDRTHHAPVLAERHLEVAILETARAVGDLDLRRAEDGPRVPGAERRQRHHLRGNRTGELPELERFVDAQPRTQVVGPEPLVGIGVDPVAQLADPVAAASRGPPPPCARRTCS